MHFFLICSNASRVVHAQFTRMNLYSEFYNIIKYVNGSLANDMDEERFRNRGE